MFKQENYQYVPNIKRLRKANAKFKRKRALLVQKGLGTRRKDWPFFIYK